jgi:hypothetical protein
LHIFAYGFSLSEIVFAIGFPNFAPGSQTIWAKLESIALIHPRF